MDLSRNLYELFGTGSPVGDADANRAAGSEYWQLDGGVGGVRWYKVGALDTDWSLSGGGLTTDTASLYLAAQALGGTPPVDPIPVIAADNASNVLASNLLAPQLQPDNRQYLPLSGGVVTGSVVVQSLVTTGIINLASTQWLAQATPNLVANTNNLATGNVFQVAVQQSAAWNLTGLVAIPGALLLITNISAFNLTLTEQDAASTATNRFATGQALGLTLIPNYSVFVYYDSTTQRWRTVRYV